jgi:hypothetical protein
VNENRNAFERKKLLGRIAPHPDARSRGRNNCQDAHTLSIVIRIAPGNPLRRSRFPRPQENKGDGAFAAPVAALAFSNPAYW